MEDPSVVVTPQMTFHWPRSSTPDYTSTFLRAVNGQPSPLRADRFEYYLRDYPDRPLVDNVLRGIREGFPIGFTKDRTHYRCPSREYSDTDYDLIIAELEREVSLGRMAGPFTSLPTTGPYSEFSSTIPTFVIPKKIPGKFRRIEHCSYPPGASVNDGIDKNDFPVHFASVDSISEAILECGPDCLVSNYDIQDAYRHVPLNPADCPLFCFEIRGKYYLQTRAGFGICSLPGLFDTLSYLVAWILLHFTMIPGYVGSGLRRVEQILDD